VPRPASRGPALGALAALLGVVALLCGCGGRTAATGKEPPLGKIVFEHACAGCHTLTGRDNPISGGDLASARLTVGELRSFVRAMPVRLSPAAVDAVAAYVHTVVAATKGG
jgi:mono/diheme cytochrome c family protein